jgi:hypothetical protein
MTTNAATVMELPAAAADDAAAHSVPGPARRSSRIHGVRRGRRSAVRWVMLRGGRTGASSAGPRTRVATQSTDIKIPKKWSSARRFPTGAIAKLQRTAWHTTLALHRSPA